MLIFFPTREKARKFASAAGKSVIDTAKKYKKTSVNGHRWAIDVKKQA